MSVLLQSLLVFSAVLAIYVLWRSIVVIGPAEIGLVVKRVSGRHNTTDTPIAFAGEAGYQAELLMPGVRFKLWPTYIVVRYPWVQVPAGEIGVGISQNGEPPPTGAQAARDPPQFGQLTNPRTVLESHGQKGGHPP